MEVRGTDMAEGGSGTEIAGVGGAGRRRQGRQGRGEREGRGGRGTGEREGGLRAQVASPYSATL
eukprot:1507724-Rhodomonas_salina.2